MKSRTLVAKWKIEEIELPPMQVKWEPCMDCFHGMRLPTPKGFRVRRQKCPAHQIAEQIDTEILRELLGNDYDRQKERDKT